MPSKHIVDLRNGGTKDSRKLKVEKEPEESGPEEYKEELLKEPGILYEWRALEFSPRPKDVYWFLMLGVGSALIVVFFILTKNYLGGLVILLLAILAYIYGKREPREIALSITPRGIMIDQALHRFEDLKSFWIFYDPPEMKELSIRTKKLLTPYLIIQLGKANPVKIRQILLDFLPEKKQEESIANILAKRFGF